MAPSKNAGLVDDFPFSIVRRSFSKFSRRNFFLGMHQFMMTPQNERRKCSRPFKESTAYGVGHLFSPQKGGLVNFNDRNLPSKGEVFSPTSRKLAQPRRGLAVFAPIFFWLVRKIHDIYFFRVFHGCTSYIYCIHIFSRFSGISMDALRSLSDILRFLTHDLAALEGILLEEPLLHISIEFLGS